MAENKKIPDLPDIEEVTGDEEFPVSYMGKNYNMNVSQVKEYIGLEPISEKQIDSLFAL